MWMGAWVDGELGCYFPAWPLLQIMLQCGPEPVGDARLSAAAQHFIHDGADALRPPGTSLLSVGAGGLTDNVSSIPGGDGLSDHSSSQRRESSRAERWAK